MLNAIFRQEERRRHIVMKRVTDEVEKLAFAPWCLGPITIERLSRLIEYRRLFSRACFYPNAVVVENSSAARYRERGDKGPRPPCVNLDQDIPKAIRLLLDLEGAAAEREAEVDRVHAPPIIQATMCG
jgi:hypothetical protein